MNNKIHNKYKKKTIINFLIFLIMVIYLIIFSKIVLFKNGLDNSFRFLNLNPLISISSMINNEISKDVFLKNILGNIFIFLPMGILINILSKDKKIPKTCIIVFLLSLSIEIFQYITGLGISDIEDLILNVFGGFLGSFIHIKFLNKLDKKYNISIFTLIFLIVFGLIGLISLWFFQPNIIPINPVTIINEDILNNIDYKNPDFQGKILDISSSNLNIEYYSIDDMELKKPMYKSVDISKINFYLQIKTFDYSSNGMIQKTYLKFKSLNKDDLIKYKNNKIYIWNNNNDEFQNIIINIIQK